MINGLKPWDDATADAAIDLMRLELPPTSAPMTTSTRNLDGIESDVDAILSCKAALDNASVPLGLRWLYLDGVLQSEYIYPRDFYRRDR